MATWDKATLATRTLEHMGLIGEGQAASSEQQDKAEEVIDSVYPQLRKLGLVPFAIAAIPEWAQQPLVKYLAAELAPRYGFSGQRLAEWLTGQRRGQRDLEIQTSGEVFNLPTKSSYH